jgi:alkanesulfonate monooxygenase SsuD/methylene tetrahydromethanopterin reductase-like flavin-dependent oxidoreductase (luciferase family)
MSGTRDVFLPVAAQPSVDALVEQAQRGEELGYDRAWLPETWGRSVSVVLTSIAEHTEEIGIGTSIMPVYSRSPALIGMTAATLQEVSDGRMRLGLGPSGPIVIENWHGVDFGNPLKRTRETVDVVKQVLSGEEVEYDGDYFDLSGFRLRHALMLTRDGLNERLEDLERGAELAGKEPEDVRTTLSLTCCALEDGEHARDLVRQHLAFYLGGMGTYYRDNLARQGHEALAHGVYDAWNDGRREEATAMIDDDLLDSMAVAGTPDRARDLLEEFEALDGVDAPDA